MAEATDRPQVPGQVPPDAVMSGEERGTRAPAEAETYQPLSLLALAGFGLAVVYALVVLVGGAVALFGHIPWLMPNWTFLLPIAALIVCWAAATRIRNSEGTLSGLAFTTWGSRLAILFGLTYAAYYAATFFAVRGPAIDCANDFFLKIKEGHLEQAFLMSQSVSTKGMDNSQLRDMLEARFNQPSSMRGDPGPFTRFRQERFVRFIEMGGDKASTTPTGVVEWEYGKGGYRVILNYHVATALVEFDMNVETFGPDPKPGEPKGRKWQVRLTRGETSLVPDSLKLTPQGEEFGKKTEKAQSFASEWLAKANALDALTPAERADLAKKIRIDDKTFWAGQKQREEIKKLIHDTFQVDAAGKKKPFNLGLQPGTLPLMRESDGRTTLLFDVALRYMEEGVMMPQYVVEGRLMVSAESGAIADSSAWRVDALDIESGRTLQDRRKMMQEARPSSAPSPQP